MKYKKYLLLCFFLFLMTLPMISYGPADVSSEAAVAVDLPKREEVLWSSGYWAGPNTWNPFFWSEAWGTHFMYQPLFEINFEKDELMGIIGESMEWNADGSKLTIKIRPEAKWSDGTDITADDVIYSYDYLLSFRHSGFAERVDSMTKTDAKTVEVNMNTDFKYSRVVYEGFIGYNRIGPKHVWEEIVDWATTNVGDWGGWELMEFFNNWLETGFDEDWKVASGPYLPYYVDPTLNKEIYKRDDNWWGNDIFGKPVPEYIGALHYATNFAVNTAFRKDEIDWYGGYYPRIWELLDENPNIHCWTDKEPYFPPISGMVELVPNHLRYPFNEPWLRKALAYAINYEDMSEVSASGYLQKARVGYIDDRSPTQDQVYDPSIEEEYAIEFNSTKAVEILEEYAFKHTDGAWYTKDTPAKYYDPAHAEYNTSGTPAVGSEGLPLVDALPDETGFNVKLGGWNLDVVYGWSDSMMQTTLLSTYFNDIGISTTPAFIEYGTYEANFQAMDFDIMHFVMGFAPSNTVQEGLVKFTGDAGNWVNFSGWYSPTYDNLMEDLEITPEGSAEEKEVVSDMMELLATEMPHIPMYPNGYWYAYNDKYWTNWPNEKDPYIQATAPWATGRTGAMLYVVLNVKKTGEVGGIPWNFTAILLGLLAAGLIVVRKRKK
ncbi:MAG: ABC transporter substrate-binding protein [Candidatus Hodarchaeota archaeon]